jgi:hypothetical protein
MKIEFKFDEINFNRAEVFFNYYEFETIIGDANATFHLGTETNPLKCRFCNRSYPEVSFEKDAHVIPQFMGNKNLLSFFECDECNQLFAKHESSFANYFGIGRTFAQIKGQSNKIPKFKDRKSGLEVEVGNSSVEITIQEGNDPTKWDEVSKSFAITTTKPGYTPLHILKMIVKMALCMLSEEEINGHQTTRKFVVETDNDAKYKDMSYLKVFTYFVPGPPIYTKPFVQLYKLKEECKDEILPTRQIIIMYANYQFQMVLPFADRDKRLIGTKPNLPILPLLVNHERLEKFGEYQFSILDFSSHEKRNASEHIVTFSYDSYVDLMPNNPVQDGS